MALTKVTSGMVNPDPTNASNLSSGDVPLAQLGNAPATDTSGIEADIALIAFKVTANGSLAKYNLVDQIIDGFEDSSGVDGTSTNATVDPTNNYISGRPIVAHDPYSTYTAGDGNNSIDSSTPRVITIGTQGQGNYITGAANIGPSGLNYISNGNGYDISYIVTDDTAISNGSFSPGFKYLYATAYNDVYRYQVFPTYFNTGDTIKTNLLSNGSTATITWYHKASGESTFTQLNQTTGLAITNWFVWIAGWCDAGDIKASYTAEYTGAPTDMTLISTATTAEDGAPTKGDLVVTYTDGAGTAVVGTDIKFYISRDGTNYTGPITMASQGTSGGHKILTAHDVSLTSTSGTSMRYKITTHNQSVSKDTRIQAVSLGWS
tara:strand:+ start:626 stop:1756 length:1131 start_codon:yes stop_codon:yes gene_type:complete